MVREIYFAVHFIALNNLLLGLETLNFLMEVNHIELQIQFGTFLCNEELQTWLHCEVLNVHLGNYPNTN